MAVRAQVNQTEQQKLSFETGIHDKCIHYVHILMQLLKEQLSLVVT